MPECSFADSHPIGVRGLLLCLCVVLCFAPLLAVARTISAYHELASAFRLAPSLYIAWSIEALISVGVSIYTLYTAGHLCRERSGAVTNAKWFFFLMPIVLFVSVVPYLLFTMPTDRTMAMMHRHLADAFTVLFVSLICQAYLRRSQRVRNTFPDDFPLILSGKK